MACGDAEESRARLSSVPAAWVGPEKPGFATSTFSTGRLNAARGPGAGRQRSAAYQQDEGNLVIIIRFIKYQLIYKTPTVYRYAM
jgi:hypothetical protein